MTALSRYIFKNINPYVSKLPTDYVYENAPLVEYAYSSIAQSVEHSAVNRSVVGSSPTWGVKRKLKINRRLLGQAVKTSPFHGGNTGSIPVGVIALWAMVQKIFVAYADVAQLAEQLICNQQVIGSSPIIGFIWTISSVG